jgi:DNA-binding MarR family transcriptional regulator
MTTHARTDLNAVADAIQRDIREIREALRRPLEAEFTRGGLTGPQRSVMQAVFQSQGLSLKELSSRVALSHSTVSSVVDRLELRGLLQRRVNATDRRLSTIEVTPLVRDFMLKKAPRLVSHPLARALAQATAADRQNVIRGLKALRRVMGIEPVL